MQANSNQPDSVKEDATKERLSISSLERLVPDQLVDGESTGAETLQLHLQRYQWAARHLATQLAERGISQCDSRILDSACGAGYGSALIAEALPEANVTGVDIDPEAVEYARKRYADAGAIYQLSNLLELQGEGVFDASVSLETIEHVPDPAAALQAFRRLLTDDGIFIGSVPVTPSVDVNPYHLTDFTRTSFLKLLNESGFEVIDELMQVQKFSVVKIASGKEHRLDDMRQNLPSYYLKNPSAALKRAWSTVRYGFTNRYLTVLCRTTKNTHS